MKRILITGEGSYIGTSFENWVNQWPEKYRVEVIDVQGDKWRNLSFIDFDVVYHVAAIVHVKENNTEKYFKVNRDLTFEIAKKAKSEGVKQFIFLSTMGVYGKETGHIDEKTKENPKTPYAESKLEAEGLLWALADDTFKIATLRPPIVYGKDCRGNYPRLAELALRLPFFPKIANERSMIYIDNLSEFVKQTIDNELYGIYFPQNRKYVNTTELVQMIAKFHGKKVHAVEVFNPLISFGIRFSETFGKVFGTFIYDMKLSGSPCEYNYEVCSFEESVLRTET